MGGVGQMVGVESFPAEGTACANLGHQGGVRRPGWQEQRKLKAVVGQELGLEASVMMVGTGQLTLKAMGGLG